MKVRHDLVLPDRVDQPVALDEDLAHGFIIHFWDSAPSFRKLPQGASNRPCFVNQGSRIAPRISGDEARCAFDLLPGRFGPLYSSPSHALIRTSISSWSITFPSSTSRSARSIRS